MTKSLLDRYSEADYYRIYKDDDTGIYERWVGNKLDFKFKAKRWDKPIQMQIGAKPVKNFVIVK